MPESRPSKWTLPSASDTCSRESGLPAWSSLTATPGKACPWASWTCPLMSPVTCAAAGAASASQAATDAASRKARRNPPLTMIGPPDPSDGVEACDCTRGTSRPEVVLATDDLSAPLVQPALGQDPRHLPLLRNAHAGDLLIAPERAGPGCGDGGPFHVPEP